MISTYAPIVEKASIDEWYVDLTDVQWHSVVQNENCMRVHSNGKLRKVFNINSCFRMVTSSFILKTHISDPTASTEGNIRRWETSRLRKANSQVNCIRKAIFDQLGIRDYSSLLQTFLSIPLLQVLLKSNS